MFYKSEIVMLDMSIEDGAKLIVSAGLVAPEYKRKVVGTDGKPIEISFANPAIEDISQPARSNRTASSRPNR